MEDWGRSAADDAERRKAEEFWEEGKEGSEGRNSRELG